MDTTTSRAEFEKWWKIYKKTFYKGRSAPFYHLCWKSWQAARESIVIDLPQKISDFNRMPDNGAILLEALNYDEAIDDCADAIRSAGLTVKGGSE